MKKTTWIEFISIFKRTWISFVTVFILTAAGVGVFTGFEWGVKATELSIDKVHRDQNFHTYEVFSSILMKDDLTIAAADAEGVVFAYRFFDMEGRRVQAKIMSMTERIDVLYQVEGKLPDAPSELLLEKHFAEVNGFHIGDRIRFEDEENMLLPEREFTITALAESPAYMSDEACTYGIAPDALNPVECLMYVSRDAFSPALSGYSMAFLVAGNVSEDELKTSLSEAFGGSAEDFSVLTRSDNLANNLIDNSIDAFRKLKISMGAMLVLISQVVSFIFLGKVVKSHRKTVGMKKALGFCGREIVFPYLMYGILSAFLGAVAGIILGRYVLETVFLNINRATIFFTESVTYISIAESLVIVAAEIALSGVIVLLAVRRVMAADALDLLNSREKNLISEGMLERTSWWDRLSVLTQAAINNMRAGRGQRLSMILCIAGCTLLLVSSFTVKDLVAGSFTRHYSAIQGYDSLIYFDASLDGAAENIREILLGDGYSAALLHSENGSIEDADGKGVGAYLFVPLDGEYEKMFTYHESDGITISQAYAEHYGLRPGDCIRFISFDGRKTEFAIDGICEYYLQMPCIHMPAERFREIFGTEPAGNVCAADTGKTAAAAAFDELRSTDGYIVSYDMYSVSKVLFDNMSFVCTTVVVIFTVLSLIMAVFVILSLIHSAVEGRKREIIVMQINGVPCGNVMRYVYTDIAVYGVIAIILGNIGGYWFGRLTTGLLSGYTDCFLKTVSVRALCTGTGISAFLVLVMCLLSRRRIDRFGLADLVDDTGE